MSGKLRAASTGWTATGRFGGPNGAYRLAASLNLGSYLGSYRLAVSLRLGSYYAAHRLGSFSKSGVLLWCPKVGVSLWGLVLVSLSEGS